MKAYRVPDGSIQLFRPEKNAERMQNTNRRMCLPSLPTEDFIQAVKALVQTDADWVPHQVGTSLYIRPFVIATEPHLGVRPSQRLQFIHYLFACGGILFYGHQSGQDFRGRRIHTCLPGWYRIYQCGGNYAASLISQVKAHELGYEQTLWLDGVSAIAM